MRHMLRARDPHPTNLPAPSPPRGVPEELCDRTCWGGQSKKSMHEVDAKFDPCWRGGRGRLSRNCLGPGGLCLKACLHNPISGDISHCDTRSFRWDRAVSARYLSQGKSLQLPQIGGRHPPLGTSVSHRHSAVTIPHTCRCIAR